MKALNLYTLTRGLNLECLSLFEKSLSDRDKIQTVRKEKIEIIDVLVNEFDRIHANSVCYEDWFYSFSIPQISKEFDLLKIGNNKVINVELKSQEVSEEKIITQLKQNRTYLSIISSHVENYACVKSSDQNVGIYKLNDGDLILSSITELIDDVGAVEDPKKDNLEALFRPKDYLISPLNTPERFLEGRYFLTNQQYEIKKQILDSVGRNLVWGISGDAGTGKTFLLYDIAKELAERFAVGLIHCSHLSVGHQYLNRHLDNLFIIEPKDFSEDWAADMQVICVDETQRIYSDTLEKILLMHEEEIFKNVFFLMTLNRCFLKVRKG